MTTTPLPPLPPVEKEWCEDSHMYVQPTIPKYGSYEMHAYATQARADLEAEVARLREALSAIERKDALLRQALEALNLYKAYGWPDRSGVIPAITKELSQ